MVDKLEMNIERFSYKNPITIIERFCSKECREYCYSESLTLDLQEDYDIEVKWIFQEVNNINIYKLFETNKQCNHCGTYSNTVKRCAKCYGVEYCDSICQKKNWKIHRQHCKNNNHASSLTFF